MLTNKSCNQIVSRPLNCCFELKVKLVFKMFYEIELRIIAQMFVEQYNYTWHVYYQSRGFKIFKLLLVFVIIFSTLFETYSH